MLNITPYTAYKSCWFESSTDLFLTEIAGLVHTLFKKKLKNLYKYDKYAHCDI